MSDIRTVPFPPADAYKILWAKSKPRHPLWKHMLDASAVSLALSPHDVSFAWKPEATALLVGPHDIGKIDSRFQHQYPDFADELINAGTIVQNRIFAQLAKPPYECGRIDSPKSKTNHTQGGRTHGKGIQLVQSTA